jgi:hypothetical protein
VDIGTFKLRKAGARVNQPIRGDAANDSRKYEALVSIAETTLENITLFERDGICQNEVTLAMLG